MFFIFSVSMSCYNLVSQKSPCTLSIAEVFCGRALACFYRGLTTRWTWPRLREWHKPSPSAPTGVHVYGLHDCIPSHQQRGLSSQPRYILWNHCDYIIIGTRSPHCDAKNNGFRFRAKAFLLMLPCMAYDLMNHREVWRSWGAGWVLRLKNNKWMRRWTESDA